MTDSESPVCDARSPGAAPRVRRGSVRALRQRPIVRERRGAVLVWAGFIVLALMAFSAFAVDFGGFYVTAAELQTAADAGALAGARTLQRSSAIDAATREAQVDAMGVAITNANRVWGSALAITGDSVQVGWWNPTTRSFGLAVPTGRTPNAVRVGTSRQTGFMLGRVLQNFFGTPGAPLLRRHAVAWIANVNKQPCVQPWALPYNALYKVATGIAATGTNTPMLTQADLVALSDKPESQRIVRILGPNPDHIAEAGTKPYDGRWRAFSYGNTAGNNQYQNALSCAVNYEVMLTELNQQGGTTLPSQGNNVYERSTEQGFTQWASNAPAGAQVPYFAAGNDARCYADAARTRLGCPFTIVWGIENGTGPDGWNGSSAITFKSMGQFVLLCYFKTATQSCPDSRVSAPQGQYPVGTIIGIVQGLRPIIIERSTTMGNIVTDEQKLLLVQ
jgi:Flp pilus assembly protein TadG